MRRQSDASHCLARLRPTKPDNVCAGRFGTKVMVEADDAVDFIPSQVEFSSYDGNRLGRDESDLILNCVKYRQKRPGLFLQDLNNSRNMWAFGLRTCLHTGLIVSKGGIEVDPIRANATAFGF